MKLTELVNFSIGLSVTPAQSAGFSVPLHLSDTTDVPIDKRYRIVSRSDYATALTASTPARDWAAILWGQDYNVAEAYIGRWVSAASSPHFIMPNATSVVATWAAVSDGDLRITDGTNNDDLTGLDFSLATSMADVCDVIETALQAIAVPNIAGLDTATCALDAYDRPVITNSTTGASAATISAVQLPAGAGTDISAAAYLSVSTGFSVAGLDAEDPDDALAATLASDDTPFVIHLDDANASAAQQLSLAVACAAYKKMYELVVRDTDAKDSGSTTDVAALISAVSNNNCHGTYTEHDDQFPNAAFNGQIYPLPEGSTSIALNGISQCGESGLGADLVTTIPLTAAERSALDDKGCDYLVQPVNVVHAVNGLTFGGVEVRHRVGYYWAEKRSSEEIYAFLLNQRVTTYSDTDIQAIGAIVDKYLQELVKRKCLEPGYTLNLPTAADISLIEKATHTLTLSDIAALVSQYAINNVVMTASATV